MRTGARLLVLLLLPPLLWVGAQDLDRDRDGLSDFQEEHKYFTDPEKADSDGDGVPDGAWLERREYTYVVRSVVQVMKPVTIAFLDDDYQDARLLDETDTYAELEVIHYPFNTVAEAIRGAARWRRDTAGLKRWTEPGPTSDWTPAMRRQLVAALGEDGIDVDRLDDRELVEKAAAWLMKRAEYHDGFTSFITAFDAEGRPFVPPDLRDAAERGMAEKGLTLEDQWAREISARGMFENRARGSCTSSAIYLSGCLRALGIPTRTVLCIPVIDASDEREMDLVRRNISHNRVRAILEAGLGRIRGSWASHTFNEVFVGGRWRRLNYAKLGQNILDEDLFGLLTHVATFRDWADAKMPETIGRRQGLRVRDDIFGGPNPYSTISLRDEFGAHCRVPNPAPEQMRLSVDRFLWSDDAAALPEDVFQGLGPRGRFGLVAHIPKTGTSSRLRRFLQLADLRVDLEAPGHPRLSIAFDPHCWWRQGAAAWIYLPFGPADRRDLATGVPYSARAPNEREDAAWDLPEDPVVRR